MRKNKAAVILKTDYNYSQNRNFEHYNGYIFPPQETLFLIYVH